MVGRSYQYTVMDVIVAFIGRSYQGKYRIKKQGNLGFKLVQSF